ncbi:MAG: hypothetical protein A2172_04455 [Candidatus Woykebacteria bacterium RBG_13_40_15]|uniref:Major facilitator superfamily (MFS) profile domain-containing protein n=1 Tax=Candidatus Woykebacteria bacterium RBG_13_40_15 TaxID=1802593 RepID=A0A1G1W708_9BACT|nr:MAG: hypothetical protein A2172_04455 [Candidatus Woykebacteria bacterium RBG_13_40_15]
MSKEENLLNKILWLYYTANALAGIFLNVFLFTLGGFKATITYNLIALISLYIFYVISAWSLRRFSSTQLIRFGLLAGSLCYLSVVILREQAINYLIPLGILAGAAAGNFWPGFNLSQFILTEETSRHAFFGRQNFLGTIANISGPLISGAIIGLSGILATKLLGYTVVFSIVSIFMFFTFLEAAKLPEHKGVDFSVLHIFEHIRGRNWKIVLSQQFLNGFWDTSLGLIIIILIFVIVKQEFTLGLLNSLAGVVFAIANIMAIRILQKNRKSILLGMIFPPLGILIFFFMQNFIGIIILVTLFYIFYPLIDITLKKSYFDTIDEAEGSWQNKYHFLIERETVLDLGRFATYLILFAFFTPTNQLQVAKAWLLVVPVLIFAVGILQFYRFKQTPA